MIMCILCQRLDISDKHKMDYFVFGLRTDIREVLLMEQPKNFDEAERLARRKVL